jgi:putative holliday junction resolvase
MKLLGMDYGRSRIGVAVTDETGSIIRGLTTINRKQSQDVIADLVQILTVEMPSTIIVGLPLDVDNNETAMSEEIRIFAAKIGERTAIPIKFMDESYSSIRSAELLRSRKKKERRVKASVDRIAACIILETYIRDNVDY